MTKLAQKDSDMFDAGQALRQKFAQDPNAFAVAVAGPSGVGKTSICEAIMLTESDIKKCVTTTTRSARSDEVDGIARHFVSVDEFQSMHERGDFVECAEVHGHFYGATFAAVAEALSGGHVMLMDVDVQGVSTWKKVLEDRCVTVFVVPPSLDVLAERLASRQSEGESTFKLRIQNAIDELAHADICDYVVVNATLENAIADLMAIIRAERHRTMRVQDQLQGLSDA